MASILPGYEYDIFISYRHNDNLDGWVTDFVHSLENELKSTVKEQLSIYFDKNPHDGLLETHLVDKSLEKKLKCLIFISVISQTYCDSKSFAWQHEFCAFSKQARNDSLGLEVRLANGNVSSRVLPVKIHTLDSKDYQAIEKELESPLRPIEFIYTEAGVNRPLRQHEENPIQNQNQTLYRNQVNKVANAVKTLVAAMTNQDLQPEPRQSASQKQRLSAYRTPDHARDTSINSRARFAFAIALTAVASAGITWFLTSRGPEKSAQNTTVVRSIIVPPPGTSIELIGEATVGIGRRAISISYDGRKIAFIGKYKGRPHIFIRDLDTFQSIVLDQTAGAYGCALSPDGNEVAYFIGNTLQKMKTAGGNPIVLAESSNPLHIEWTSNTELFYATEEGLSLYKVGRQVELVTRLSDEGFLSKFSFRSISAVPNTKYILVSSEIGNGVLDLSTNKFIDLGLVGECLKFIPPNRVAYIRGATLFVRSFDTEKLVLGDDESYALPNVRVEGYGQGQFDISGDGSLIYIEGKDIRVGRILSVARDGKSDTLTRSGERFGTFKLSPDETKLAAPIINATSDLWVFDLVTGKQTRLTNSGGIRGEVWSGNNTIYFVRGDSTYRLNPGKENSPQFVLRGQVASASADGKKLMLMRDFDLFVYDTESGKDQQVTNTSHFEVHGSISPDARLVAYTLNDSKAFHVYLKHVEPGGKSVQISVKEGSEEPRWTSDGNRIIYRSGQQWFEVDVLEYETLEVSQPRLVIEGDYYNIPGFSFDITGDGERLLLVKTTEEKVASGIRLVQGWLAEIE